MAYTYTLTMDVGSGPWENGIGLGLASGNCGEEIIPFEVSITNIQDLASQIGNSITEIYTGSYTYSISGSTITWTWNLGENPAVTECGDLVYLIISEAINARAAFQYVTELCPTCQDVTIDNCGSIIFEVAISNGTYEVQIEDHQSGITYMQDIEFTASQGTWDQTNTAGVFTPFSVYTVTIFDGAGNPMSWIDGSTQYTCMRLTFATFTDTTPAA